MLSPRLITVGTDPDCLAEVFVVLHGELTPTPPAHSALRKEVAVHGRAQGRELGSTLLRAEYLQKLFQIRL